MLNKEANPIFLVGMMGAGKSTVGRCLAERLGMDFVDLDEELERRCGVSIPFIFREEGEEGFRRRESALIEEFTRAKGLVVATGGGAVTQEKNRTLLKNAPIFTVHLKVSAEQCYRRTKNSDRPLLQCENPLEKITLLLESRNPLYGEVASLTVDTDGKASKRVAEELNQTLINLQVIK
ncbi:shikimate kinase [Parasutterella muris]|uniref:Shikimate kinase n=1 Tax=Parasutterella muris TaxID=2565572 RepID=A0A6L6YIH3_9BURK|nr:shikimate kinase [Parasutterella muris]MVX57164.1 AAA family ATPase [Parasutterella muris]